MSAIVPIRRLAVTSGPESAHQSWCARHEDGFCYAAPIAVRVPATATCQAQDFAVEMDAEPGADSPLIALSRDGRDLLDVDVPAALRIASALLDQAHVFLQPQPAPLVLHRATDAGQAPRTDRVAVAIAGGPRPSAVQLAEVEQRYAAMLATALPSDTGPVEGELTRVAVGEPLSADRDGDTLGAQLAMWPGREGREAREFVVTAYIADMPVELTPAQAHESADSLRHLAATLDALAVDAQALTQIEAGR